MYSQFCSIDLYFCLDASITQFDFYWFSISFDIRSMSSNFVFQDFDYSCTLHLLMNFSVSLSISVKKIKKRWL